MVTSDNWKNRVRGILKAELARKNISYKDLAFRLKALGVSETEQNIANKLSRGGFSAVFMIQCLDAIECRIIHLRMD